MSGGFVSDEFDRDGDDLRSSGAWIRQSGSWGITSSTAPTWPGPAGVLDYPVPVGPPYPRRDGARLRGRELLRFRWVMLRHGFWRVRSLQVRAHAAMDVRVDGLVGPQTWFAFWVLVQPSGTP